MMRRPPRSPLFPNTTLFRSLHLSGRVRLGRNVRDLLQLQCAFERDRQADVAPQVEEERPIVEPPCDVLDRRRSAEHTSELPSQSNIVYRLLPGQKYSLSQIS